MVKMLEVYVYIEGDRPIMHRPILRGVNAPKGWFMKIIKSNNKILVTKDVKKLIVSIYLWFSDAQGETTCT